MATTNFSFTQLAGTETAGYTSINTLINSIDTKLFNRIYKTGAANPVADNVMVFTGTWSDAGTGGYWTSGKVAAASLATDAVTSVKILDSNVTTTKIADANVTLAKLAANSVDASKIVDGSIGTSELADASVSAAKLDAGLTSQNLPAGMIVPFASATLPASGWLFCLGQAVSRTTYSGLWNALGTTSSPYGQGDGSTTFNLPDLQGRIPVGKSADVEFDALGETGGVKGVTLSAAQSGTTAHGHGATTASNGTGITLVDSIHSHGVSDPGHSHNVNSRSTFSTGGSYGAAITGAVQGQNASIVVGAGTNIGINGAYTGNSISDPNHAHTTTIAPATAAAASAEHTNLQPYITLNYLIKI